MKFKGTISIIVLTLCACLLPGGEDPDPTRLTLQKIFTDKSYQKKSFGPARWLEDGRGYTVLEAVDPQDDTRGCHIVRVDPETGRRDITVPADRMVPAGTSVPLAIDDYHWSPDAKSLLIFTNTEKVWRENTRGRLRQSRTVRLRTTTEPSSHADPFHRVLP